MKNTYSVIHMRKHIFTDRQKSYSLTTGQLHSKKQISIETELLYIILYNV